MIKLTPKILEKIEEEVETSQVLDAVNFLDQIRYLIADSEDCRPPQIREDLLQLHQLLFRVIRERFIPRPEDAEKILELTDNIEDTLSSIVENAEKILEITSLIQDSILHGEIDEENGNEEE